MNEQKVSLVAAIAYTITAAVLICVFTMCGLRTSALTLQVSEEGYKGTITVEVSVAGEKIKAAKLISSEDSDFTKPIIESVLAQAAKKGSLSDSDIVSGATYSCKAVIKALNKAVEKAKESAQ